MGIRPGRKYLLIAGHTSVRGKLATVLEVNETGSKCRVQIEGKEPFGVLTSSLAATPEGDPIGVPEGGLIAYSKPHAAPVPTSVSGKPAKLNSYQKMKKRREEAETAEDIANPRRLTFKARKPPEVEPAATLVSRIGSWPKVLRPFTAAEVVITEEDAGPSFLEKFRLTLATGEGVGLVWRSKADQLWRGLGGAGSVFAEREAAIADLIRRRQPPK